MVHFGFPCHSDQKFDQNLKKILSQYFLKTETLVSNACERFKAFQVEQVKEVSKIRRRETIQ